jgi:hypothetical protein
MKVSFTIDDPKIYTAPWGWQTDFDLKKWEIQEDYCVPEDEAGYFERELGTPPGKPVPAK